MSKKAEVKKAEVNSMVEKGNETAKKVEAAIGCRYTETKKVSTNINWLLCDSVKKQIKEKVETAEKAIEILLKNGEIDSETAEKRLESISVEKFTKRLTETVFNAILTTVILPAESEINGKSVDLSKKKINGKSFLSDIIAFQSEITEAINTGKVSIINENGEMKKRYIRGFFYCHEITEKAKIGYNWIDIKSISKKDKQKLDEKAFCCFFFGFRFNLVK